MDRILKSIQNHMVLCEYLQILLNLHVCLFKTIAPLTINLPLLTVPQPFPTTPSPLPMHQILTRQVREPKSATISRGTRSMSERTYLIMVARVLSRIKWGGRNRYLGDRHNVTFCGHFITAKTILAEASPCLHLQSV